MTEQGETQPAMPPDDDVYCARHPRVATVLRCGRCGTPICPRCLVQTPVGARCPQCANVRRLPTFDVSPAYLLRGLGGGLAGGVAVGAVWGFITRGSSGFGGFFIFFIAIGIGYAIAEAVGLAANRRRGLGLQVCAVAGVLVAYFLHNLIAIEALLPERDPWGYIALLVAAAYAWMRLKF